MKKTYLPVSASIIAVCSSVTLPLSAAVVLDGSVGQAGALQGPAYQITDTLGQQSGSNLFHSFSQFSLDESESATFSGPESINNIISRVTGGELSSINGQLNSSIPNANLYFFNPAGIQVGTSASVNISGSLYLSTANYLKFSDNTQFSTQELNNSQLSIAQPSAFGFLSPPQAMTFSPFENIFAANQKVHLSGGDLTLDDTYIAAPGGVIDLRSGASDGEVQLQEFSDTFTQHGSIQISNQNTWLTVLADKAGSLYMKANHIDLQGANFDLETYDGDGGQLWIQTHDLNMDGADFFTMTAGKGKSADTLIEATGTIRLQNEADIKSGSCSGSNCVAPALSGDSGMITINAENLVLESGAEISSTTFGAGNAGDIKLNINNNFNAGGTYDANGTTVLSGIYANTKIFTENFSGKAGNIIINAKNINLTDKGTISNTSFTAGDAGTISINVTHSLSIQDDANIQNIALNKGNGGDINLNIGNSLHLSNPQNSEFTDTSIASQVSSDGSGQGGNINIKAGAIEVFDGTRISSETFGLGNAGNINIEADNINLRGFNNKLETKISSASRSTDPMAGNSGAVSIQTNTLSLANRASVNNLTEGSGNGGNISIETQALSLSGELTEINSESRSSEANAGDAGNIALTVTDKLTINNQAKITTASKQAGGGQISLNNQNLVYLNEAEITTSVQVGSGNGGDINIDKPEFVVLSHGKIVAQAIDGNGGNIFIKSDQFISTLSSLIDASSQRGLDGQIIIDSPENTTFNELAALPSDFLQADDLSRTPCGSQTGHQSRFLIRRREGMPNAEDDWLPSDPVLTSPQSQQQSHNAHPPVSLPLVAVSQPCQVKKS